MLEWIKHRWGYIKTIAATIGAFSLVAFWPPVAIGFVGVYATKFVKNEYTKIIVGTVAAAMFAILMVNIAELAVVAAMLPMFDFFEDWKRHVETTA